VLVAEDDAALRRLLEMLLSNQGYEVRAVGDGADALELVAHWTPDAFICDVMMPKLSGLSVCRELRGGTAPTLPIILLTARCFDEDIQSVLELGRITCMPKPFNRRQLMSALKELIPEELRRDDAAETVAGQFDWLAARPGLPRTPHP